MKNPLKINLFLFTSSSKKLIFVFILLLLLPFTGCKSVVKETDVEKHEVLFGEKLGDDWIWFVEGNEKNYKFYGGIKNGVPDGQGTLTDPSGKKSVVEFKNGKLKEVSTVEKPVIVESVVEAPKPVVVEVEAPKPVVVEVEQ